LRNCSGGRRSISRRIRNYSNIKDCSRCSSRKIAEICEFYEIGADAEEVSATESDAFSAEEIATETDETSTAESKAAPAEEIAADAATEEVCEVSEIAAEAE
jgi:hypothetical protein